MAIEIKQKEFIKKLEYMSGQCVAHHRVAKKKKEKRKALFYTIASVALKGAIKEIKMGQHVNL